MNQIEVGPGQLQGTPFLLSAAEWHKIQVYVGNAVALPTDEGAMARSLEVDVSEVGRFDRLIEAYGGMKRHAESWRDHTFPASVGLADDIVHYSSKVPVYYRALVDLISRLESEPTDALKAKIISVANTLLAQAETHAEHASLVAAEVTAFSNDTRADRDLVSGLHAEFERDEGTQSTSVTELRADLDRQRQILSDAEDEYDQDVIVAATTPTYAWFPFFGWAAAAVVAGVYGDRAVKAKDRLDDAREEIKRLEGEERRAVLLMTMLDRVDAGAKAILTDVNAALAVVQKIQGAWGAISSDLTNLKQQLSEGVIAEAVPFLKGLALETAMAQWASLGKAADAYRVNAYVDFQGNAQAA